MTDNIKEAVEDKIIDSINSGIAGRLIIFKPEKKGLEDYLAIERRGEYKEDKIYLQINSLVIPAKSVNFIKDFLQAEFKADKNSYLVFAYYNEITQKLEDYVWVIPSIQFRDIAEVIEQTSGKKLLRFESSSDFKSKNKYSKYLIDIKDLGDIILTALKEKIPLSFKAIDFEGKSTVNLESLKDFLCNARANTYAADSVGVENPRLLESVQREFQKASYFYRDVRFVGSKRVFGQEIIYQDSKPVWGMNYMGSHIEKLEELFLKEALLRLADKCRLGKNCDYEKREYKYQDRGHGNLEEFSGKEEVFLNNKNAYSLSYNGGIISDK
jgi:hypothetical protein